MKRAEKLWRALKNQCELYLISIWANGIMSPCLKRQFYKLLKLFRARSLAQNEHFWGVFHRTPKGDSILPRKVCTYGYTILPGASWDDRDTYCKTIQRRGQSGCPPSGRIPFRRR